MASKKTVADFRLLIEDLKKIVSVDGELTGLPMTPDRARRLSKFNAQNKRYSRVQEIDVEKYLHGDFRVMQVPPRKWMQMVSTIWSMPRSYGPGRAIYLIVTPTESVQPFGFLCLSSAPYCLPQRDDRYGIEDRAQIIELSTVGAHPSFAPYRGGSLVSLCGLTVDVGRMWRNKYGSEPALVSTTGAFGVSSIYERKKLATGRGWRRIGYTSGIYPVRSKRLLDLAYEITGEGRPDKLSIVGGGALDTYKRSISTAMLKVGYEKTFIKQLMLSMGCQRAIYCCPMDLNSDTESVSSTVEWWRHRYMKR